MNENQTLVLINITSRLQKSGARPENHDNVPQSEAHEAHSFESEAQSEAHTLNNH